MDWIWMSFGMVDRLGPRMRQIVGIGDCPTERGNFWGRYGASHYNQWGVCGVVVQVCEPIELAFGVMSGVVQLTASLAYL